MKLTMKVTAFGLVACFFLLGMVTVWHNCSVSAFGEPPTLGIRVEEDGGKILQAGEWKLPLFPAEKLLTMEGFSRYPALMPKTLRLLGGLAARKEELLILIEQRWQDFLLMLGEL